MTAPSSSTGAVGVPGVSSMNFEPITPVDPTFAVNVHALWSCRAGKSNHALALTASGQVLFSDWYTEVDGFPGSFVRLLDMPPTNDFRVVRPTEFYRATGLARIRVVRTGATTNAAAVSFRTSDDTAKAGEDYESQSGTLNFAPLEVSKEIMVPLRTRTPVEDRLVVFKLELRNPSAGYSAITATPITIVPVLRIASDLVQVRGNSVTLTLHGTQPRVRYTLESSTDLKNWQWIAENEAVGSALVFNAEVSDTLPRFYRAIRH